MNPAMRKTPQSEDSRTIPISPNATRAGLFGVGGGTGLVAIAQTVGTGTTTGQILLYLSPFASFIVGSFLYYIEIQVSRYLERRAVVHARKTLIEQLTNPHTTDEHKAKIRELLERLEESVATAELERVKLFSAPPPPWTRQGQVDLLFRIHVNAHGHDAAGGRTRIHAGAKRNGAPSRLPASSPPSRWVSVCPRTSWTPFS
jgi:hypothetical protein